MQRDARSDSTHGHRPNDSLIRELPLLAEIECRLQRYFHRALKRGADFEDLIHQVLVEVLISVGHSIAVEAAWECALTTARRCAAAARRDERHEARGHFDPNTVADDSSRLDAAAFRAGLWTWERLALSRCTIRQRAALELFEMDGLSDAEIARRIGSTPAWFRKLRHTAKRHIRDLVSRGTLPPPPAH